MLEQKTIDYARRVPAKNARLTLTNSMRNATPNTPTATFWARFDLSFGATCGREGQGKQRQTAGEATMSGQGKTT